MKVITGDRQTGKTTAMLEWMRSAPRGEHRVCVAHSRHEAMRLLRENPDLESWQFVSLDDVRDRTAFGGVLRGRGGQVVLGIDNVDLIIQRVLAWPVGAVSITTESDGSAVETAVPGDARSV